MKSQENKLDVAIIGGGPAGLSAAIYTFRKGLKTAIFAYEIGGQVAKSGDVENYLGTKRLPGPGLALVFREHIKMLDIPLYEGVLVKEISGKLGEFKILTNDGATYLSRLLIICSGRKPRKLNIPGEERLQNRGLSYCAICDGPLFRNKKVAVIGGGNSALDAALSLAIYSQGVYILNLLPHFTGDPILMAEVGKNSKIKSIFNASATEILGENYVSGLRFQEKTTGKIKTLEVDGVFVEIGQVPNTDFDRLTQKNERGEIKISQDCQTSVPGIFAAGDVTDVGYNQIAVAVGEGAKAGLSAYNLWIKKFA